MSFDTTKDRLGELDKLFIRATAIERAFRREAENLELADIMALLAMMENLTSLKELIRTERLLEDTLTGMFAVKDETESTRQKFISLFGRNAEIFLKTVLIPRLDMSLRMAEGERGDRRLEKYQTDFHKTLTAMRDKYRQIYKV